MFKALSMDELCYRLETVKNPVIVMHCRPDGDTVGSSVALAKIFKKMGKSAACICSDRLAKRLGFLTDGYVVENFQLTPEHTVISVDVASPDQLGDYKATVKVSLMIDHHVSGTPFADNFIVPDACSCGEVMYDVARTLVQRKSIDCIDESLAKSLYAAISSDTGCFKFSNASPKAYRAAAKLIEYGAKNDEINHLLFDSRDIKEIKADMIAAANLEFYDEGKVAVITVKHQEKLDAGIESEYFENAIEIARSVQGVEVAATVKENSKGEFKVSLRSVGRDVAKIAEAFGGGGHIRAAGCKVPAKNMDEAKKKLLDQILA